MTGGWRKSVAFHDVTVRYGGAGAGGQVAVDGLTLDVRPGEICVFLGPSGCGKTTTLGLVNRLVEPASGAIFLDGVDVATVDSVTLRCGIGSLGRRRTVVASYTRCST